MQSSMRLQKALSSPDGTTTGIFHTEKLQLRPSAICQTTALSQLMITLTARRRHMNQNSIFTLSSRGTARNTTALVDCLILIS